MTLNFMDVFPMVTRPTISKVTVTNNDNLGTIRACPSLCSAGLFSSFVIVALRQIHLLAYSCPFILLIPPSEHAQWHLRSKPRGMKWTKEAGITSFRKKRLTRDCQVVARGLGVDIPLTSCRKTITLSLNQRTRCRNSKKELANIRLITLDFCLYTCICVWT